MKNTKVNISKPGNTRVLELVEETLPELKDDQLLIETGLVAWLSLTSRCEKGFILMCLAGISHRVMTLSARSLKLAAK